MWSKVCVGEIADFNTEPGYGGDLYPHEPEGWPESRVLTPEFLETILLHEPFLSAQTRRGVRIFGAWFKGPISLTGGEIKRELSLRRSRLDNGAWLDDVRARLLSLDGSVVGGQMILRRAEIGSLFLDGGAMFQEVDLRGAKIGGHLAMDGSVFSETLNMHSVTVEGGLFMRDGANFQEVDLDGAKIAGQLAMVGSTFAGTLHMDSVTVEGNLFMREGAIFREVILRGAKIGGQLSMSGSTFAGTLHMYKTSVEGDLLMDGGANFQEVFLRGAKITGALAMVDSAFRGTLIMDTATVEGDLFMGEAEFQEVILIGAKIGGQIDMSGSTFAGTLNMGIATVEGALFMDEAECHEVILIGAKIGEQLSMTGSTFAGPLTMYSATVEGQLFMRGGAKFHEVNLRGAKIGDWVEMTGSTFAGTIDLRGVTVVGELKLSTADDDSVWAPGSILDLRYAKVGRLGASARLGQSGPGSTRLAGFTYDALGSIANQTDERESAKEAADFVERWLREEEAHSPQAHEQFARVLRQMGFPDRARRTLYEGKNHEVSDELRRGHLLHAGWLLVQWAMIGYGYRVWHALVWIAALVTVGRLIARNSGCKMSGSGEALGFWYSIDRLLPIMELRKSHYDVDLPRRSRVYFYFHTVMGYVLATFLLAGLSGLVG